MSAQNKSSDAFRAALTRFETTLTPKELAEMKISGLADVHDAIRKIQQKQGSERRLRNLNRIKGFLEGMKQYEELVKVFLNVSDMVAFIWGPIKFLLMVASNLTEAFDRLLDAYQRLSEQLPQVEAYANLLGDNDRMRELIELVFVDLLEFHRRALIFFKKRIWQKLFSSGWKVFETRFGQILDNLQHHKKLVETEANLLEIKAAQTDRATAEAQFDEMTKQKEKEKRIAIAAWLDGAKSHLDQLNAKAQREAYPESGRWLLGRPQMASWIDFSSDDKPLLWIRGIPGAGKTILASVVIEEAEKLNPQAAVIYFYCKYHSKDKETMTAILRELLRQYLPHDSAVLPFLYDKCATSAEAKLESPAVLKDLLQMVLTGVDKVAIVIDGLDECDELERKHTLSYLLPLIEDANRASPGSLRVLFTSQDVADMRKQLRKAAIMTLAAQDNAADIRAYTEHWALQIRSRFDLPSDDVRRIVKHVTETAKGMFLYAKLVMQNLFNSVNREDLYREIHPDNLPKGIEQAYDRIACRILSNDLPSRREKAAKLLGWIVCAKRPLMWHEIQGAAAIGIRDGTFEYENRRFRDSAKELCGSLVDVHSCGTVELVHSTARKYLLKEHVKGDDEEMQMALLCLGYLSLDCFNADASDDEIRQYVMEAHYAFQDYAVAHYIDHIKASIQNADRLSENHALLNAIEDFFFNHARNAELPSARIPKLMRPAFRALEGHGIYDRLLHLYYSRQAEASTSESATEPLQLESVVRRVRRLFEEMVTPAPAPDSADAERFRAFYGANWFKCPRPTCNRFFDGFTSARERDAHEDKHACRFRCDVPGCFAAEIGLVSEQSLKRHKASYHSEAAALFPSCRSRRPSRMKVALLFRLARTGRIDDLREQLDRHCLSVIDANNNTLLHVAAQANDMGIASLLLEYGAAGGGPLRAVGRELVHAKNKNGYCPLYYALGYRPKRSEMIELLLRHGASFNGENTDELLAIARGGSDVALTQLLLQISANAPTAFPVQDEDVIKLILSTSANIHVPLDLTQLLIVALECNDKKVAELCLESLGDKIDNGGSPLTYAILRPRFEIVRQLVEAGAQLSERGPSSEHTFRDAVDSNDAEHRKALLEYRDFEQPLKNHDKRKPITFAAFKGMRELIELLLEAGADPVPLDPGGFSGVHFAAHHSNLAVLTVFLDRSNVDVNVRGWEKQTPLHIAAARSYVTIVERLLKHPQIQVNAQNVHGETALAIAACSGKALIVKALLGAHTIDVEIKDKRERTALDWALVMRNLTIARMIESFIEPISRAHEALLQLRQDTRQRYE